MAEKKYYWLKMEEDYLDNLHFKKLRRLAGGDTYTVIYLKMMLSSIANGGVLEYKGIEDDFASELALVLDEDVENVRMVLMFLEGCNLIERNENNEFLLPEANERIGKEGASAERVRRFRAKQKQELLQSNAPSLQCNTDVTNCNADVTQRREDIEKELDKEKEEDKNKSKSKFIKPTIEEIMDYCYERNNGIDAEQFYDFYESKGWKVGNQPMKDWKACVRTWERNKKSNSNNNNTDLDWSNL